MRATLLAEEEEEGLPVEEDLMYLGPSTLAKIHAGALAFEEEGEEFIEEVFEEEAEEEKTFVIEEEAVEEAVEEAAFVHEEETP